MAFTFRIRNLGPLRAIDWSPRGVCCLTGPNGSGKTSLILALRLMQRAFEKGLPDAVATIWGGGHNIKNRDAPDGEPIEIGLSMDVLPVDNRQWRLVFVPSGGGVALIRETLTRGGDDEVLAFDGAGKGHHLGAEYQLPGIDASFTLRVNQILVPPDPYIDRFSQGVRGLGAFHDPDLYGLRINGSRTSDSSTLHARCQNAFAVLKAWRLRRQDEHRYRFVVDGLRAAFPSIFDDIDFAEAGQTVVINTYRPDDDEALSVASAANGLLAMLVQLMAVASAGPGSAVAIDEPETALHPFAIRELLRRAEAWASKYDATIMLSTHSPVVLNYFQGRPEQVFVMEPEAAVNPVRLDQHVRADWLADFLLGESYASGHFGAPVVESA